MSLRLRLSVVLTVVLIGTIVIGMTFLMLDVRRSVHDELNSSVALASKLIALALEQVAPGERGRVTREFGEQLALVGDTRHLSITVARATSLAQLQFAVPEPAGVPAWFARLVHPDPLQLMRILEPGVGPDLIVVRADASDEIRESWGELKPVIFMLLAFAIIANVLIFFVVGRALASLNQMTGAFVAIEDGEFDVQLSRVGVPDVDAIIERFNHMSAVLQRSDLETQLIARRSLAIQEDERRRLAQELHDELGQSISAIKALAVSIRERAGAHNQAIATSADTIADVSTEIYGQVRRMMAHLRPVVLDEFGLVSAIQAMIDDWNAHHEDTFCRFRTDGEVPVLPGNAAINCYRIVQEALTNIAKHARADEASVFLVNHPPSADNAGELEIHIDDDGIGFDRNTTARGLGLVGIHERVEAMNGKMELVTSELAGTHYTITIPSGAKEGGDE